MLTEKTSTILGKFCLKDESLSSVCAAPRGAFLLAVGMHVLLRGVRV